MKTPVSLPFFSVLAPAILLLAAGANAQSTVIPSDIAVDTTPDNSIPLEVGVGFGGQTNVPFVTVKICAPGTQICQSIPNILLDTGSTGLRIETRALNAEMLRALQALKDPSGNEIGECYEYAGDDNWWGSVASADIYLGSDLAANSTIELVDANYKKVPAECTGDTKMVAGEGLNGVLGVRSVRTDCYNQDCKGGPASDDHTGMGYFSCDANNVCTEYTMPENLQVMNPIYALGDDSNGYIVEMQSVPDAGASETNGKVVFGIASKPNNQIDAGISNLVITDDDSFGVVVNGVALTGFVDSGTSTYAFPAQKFGTTPCGGVYGKGDYLCPATPQTFTISFPAPNAAAPPVQVTVGSESAILTGNINASNQLATDATDGYPDYFFLGMSFFYGRKVYFGFDVPNAPMGDGPHIGFSPYTPQ